MQVLGMCFSRQFAYAVATESRHRVVFQAAGRGREVCTCGGPWPCSEAVSPGSQYDTGPGACEAVHAELNAILDVSDANRLEGARLFVTAEPCDGCLKILRTKPLREIVYLDGDGVAWTVSHPFRRST